MSWRLDPFERPVDLWALHRRFGGAHWVSAPWPEARVAFLLNGKCGNTSVKAAVLTARGLPPRAVHAATEEWSPGRCARSGFRLIGVARNPYARAVSIWAGKVRRRPGASVTRRLGVTAEVGFLEFLRALERRDDWADLHWRAQWKGMVWRGRWLPERVVKLEEPAGWAALRAELPGLPALPVRNASGAEADWRALCQGEAGAIVRRRWARDFAAFGYSEAL